MILSGVACGGGDGAGEVARLGPTTVQYGTERGLFDLTIARSGTSERTVVAWTEGDFGQGDPAWLALGDTEVRRAVFDPPEVGLVLRRWGALLAVTSGFVRWESRFVGDGTWLLSELWLDPQGAFVEFHQRPSSTLRLLTKVESLPFGDRTVVFGVDADLAIVAEVREPGEDAAASLVVLDPVAPARWALEAAPFGGEGGAIVAWVAFTEEPTQSDLRLHVARIDGLPDDPTVQVFRGDTPIPGELVDLATTTAGGLGTLWLGPDGGLLLYTATAPDEMDLASPVLDTAETAQSPALFSAGERLAVTYEAPGGTRAVLADPATGTVTAPFAWPLSLADGPAAYAPAGDGLEWAQVGPCQGDGCAENWLSTGTIELLR